MLEQYCIELITELERAEAKWPNFPKNNVVHAIAIMTEEAGECTREANRLSVGNVEYDRLRTELVQTGAMVLRCLKNLDNENTQKPKPYKPWEYCKSSKCRNFQKKGICWENCKVYDFHQFLKRNNQITEEGDK